MFNNVKKSIAVSLVLIFLAFLSANFVFFEKSLAAGISNISVTLANSTTSGSGTVAVSFNIEDVIPVSGTIEIEFPSDFSNLNVSSSTGTNIGTSPSFGTGDTATTVEITVGAGGSSTGSAVTASGFTITNPSEDGFYLVQIRTYNSSDVILGMGFKLVEIGSPIDIASKIEESLVVSLDSGSKNFSPDPAVNSGAVTDQVSTLTVQTNAETSYMIKGELAGNKLTASGSEITSNSGADDYFRIGSIELNLESGSGSAASDNTVFSGSTSIFEKDSGVSTNGDLISVHYDLDISYYKPFGTYTGSLVYTVYPTF